MNLRIINNVSILEIWKKKRLLTVVFLVVVEFQRIFLILSFVSFSLL